jgi:Zn-dependent protease with chaperone function
VLPVALEGPDYPPHPPLTHPGWWRDRRLWWAALAVLVALIVVAGVSRIMPSAADRPAAQAASSGAG